MAKRFTKPTINWSELAKRVPPDQKTKFNSFMAKAHGYLRRVDANPPVPPDIDWAGYMKSVPIPGLVERFKKEYNAIKVPYPTDNLSAKVDEQWTKLQDEIKIFRAERQKDIDKANEDIAKIKALPKFEEMTMEMAYDIYPDIAIDPVKKPTFWPHTPEEQPGYETPEQKALKGKH